MRNPAPISSAAMMASPRITLYGASLWLLASAKTVCGATSAVENIEWII